MNIVITDAHAVNPGDLSWDCIRKFGDVTVYERTSYQEAFERLKNADIILINKTPITEELLDACQNIKLICVLATGYNVVDCKAASKRGITVCNVPNYSTGAVSQFTFSLLLELCNRVGHHDMVVHEGKWTDCKDFCFWDTPQVELAGKTIGIIGFGRIGRAVGKIAKAMGMNVIAYSRSRSSEGEKIGSYVDFDYLLSKSDVISLHCSLSDETFEIIDKSALEKMKDGVMLINTARGQLLDEPEVAKALLSGKLKGLAVDVATVEPISKDNPLLSAPNCIITPHMAWAPLDSRKRILACTVENITEYLNKSPINVVN